MTTIRLEFPAGRYHATPHGRHVNEGVPEWPPSPYRLLRALYDVWQRKCPTLIESEVEEVLSALASETPRFYLPQATATHTRSYLSANSQDPSNKNLVFDAFLAFDRDAVCFLSWPNLELGTHQRDVLQTLLSQVNYLGRSESWVQARLEVSSVFGIACDPLEIAEGSGEAVPVACVRPREDYSGKTGWLQALTITTTQVNKQKLSGPPLLKHIRYLRPENCIENDPVRKPIRRPASAQAVLLIFDSSVLPLATETISVAEQIRMRLMGAHKRRQGGDERRVSDLFSGKNSNGQKRLDHGHLYILPLTDKNGQRINRVLLSSRLRPWAQDELDAAYGVRMLYQSGDRPEVRCAVAWQGKLGELRAVWSRTHEVISATPFIPPRHPHKNSDFGTFLRDEARRECRNHGLPEPLTVDIEQRIRGSFFECVEYRRNRKDDPVRSGYALRLTFAEPVTVPFAIGYGAHFGMGHFRSASD